MILWVVEIACVWCIWFSVWCATKCHEVSAARAACTKYRCIVPTSTRTCKLFMLGNVPSLQKISGLRHNFMDFDNFCWKMCGQTSSKWSPNLRRIRKLWKRLSRNCSGTFFSPSRYGHISIVRRSLSTNSVSLPRNPYGSGTFCDAEPILVFETGFSEVSQNKSGAAFS